MRKQEKGKQPAPGITENPATETSGLPLADPMPSATLQPRLL